MVHFGGGATALIPDGPFLDPTIAKPRKNQTLAGRLKAIKEAEIIYLVAHGVKQARNTRYGPRAIADLREDHCRFIREDGLYCGCKVKPNTSWCAEHYAAVYVPWVRKVA